MKRKSDSAYWTSYVRNYPSQEVNIEFSKIDILDFMEKYEARYEKLTAKKEKNKYGGFFFDSIPGMVLPGIKYEEYI